MTQNAAVIIVAAGRGHRLGGETPKQYLPLEGACSLRRAVEACLAHAAVRTLRTVIHPDDQQLYDWALSGVCDPRLGAPVLGGATRAASVRAGLEAIADAPPDVVLVHDAARPFLTAEVLQRVLEALTTSEGACAALRVVDALWRGVGARATQPLARDDLWRAQTPQGFDFARILAAHRNHDGTGADDVAVAHEAGMTVQFVLGDEGNYKITTPADLARARRDLGGA